MLKMKRAFVALLAIGALFTTLTPASAIGATPYGMLDEQSKTSYVPASNGGGCVYTWSQVRVNASSVYLLDQSIRPSYSNASIYNRMTTSGTTVYFKGDYTLTPYGWWSYTIPHYY